MNYEVLTNKREYNTKGGVLDHSQQPLAPALINNYTHKSIN